jgi:FKBP-type peptidyl-prolyl cis-trans isomerase
MTRSFIIFALVCLLALAVFVYFIFGFNQGALHSTAKTDSLPQTTNETVPADLKIEDTQEGTGQEVKSGDTVVIHYKGTLTDGTQFDSSYERGEPYETPIGIGAVIKGWDLGVVGMKVGGKRKLTIPPSLGYGAQSSEKIPSNSTLIFELELVGIK